MCRRTYATLWPAAKHWRAAFALDFVLCDELFDWVTGHGLRATRTYSVFLTSPTVACRDPASRMCRELNSCPVLPPAHNPTLGASGSGAGASKRRGGGSATSEESDCVEVPPLLRAPSAVSRPPLAKVARPVPTTKVRVPVLCGVGCVMWVTWLCSRERRQPW